MADVKAFRAIRPAKEFVQRVAALPYDVYDRKEARAEALKDPLSFLNIDRPETQFEESHDIYAPDVYEKAASMLQEQLAQGVLAEDPQDAYYVYELTMNGRTQAGIVACASIDDYLGGVIKKHENTREDKLRDRIRHVDVCGMQTGPIFLTYRRCTRISDVSDRVREEKTPLFDFVSPDGIRHRGWIIDDPRDLAVLKEAFAGIDSIYIADGHHRAESAVRSGLMRRERHPGYTGSEEFNYFLSVLFPDDELMILDYNRVVSGSAISGRESLDECLRKVMSLQECGIEDAPSGKGEMQVYFDHKWYQARFLPEYLSDDPVEGLDVSLLQRHVLEPFFGIRDPKTDDRIEFVGGIRGPLELQKRADRKGGIAFRMYPTSIGELMSVADSGRLMPPKSTWFEPKLRSGLFLHNIGA